MQISTSGSHLKLEAHDPGPAVPRHLSHARVRRFFGTAHLPVGESGGNHTGSSHGLLNSNQVSSTQLGHVRGLSEGLFGVVAEPGERGCFGFRVRDLSH